MQFKKTKMDQNRRFKIDPKVLGCKIDVFPFFFLQNLQRPGLTARGRPLGRPRPGPGPHPPSTPLSLSLPEGRCVSRRGEISQQGGGFKRGEGVDGGGS